MDTGGGDGHGGGGRYIFFDLLHCSKPDQTHAGRGGGGHKVTGLQNTMVALKLQQFQYDLKKSFLRRLVFPMLLVQSELGGGRGTSAYCCP